MSTQTQHHPIQHRNVNTKNQAIRHMHKYVLAMVSIFVLFIATFPLAYIRVSSSNKYGGDAFKSLKWEESQRANSSDAAPRKAR